MWLLWTPGLLALAAAVFLLARRLHAARDQAARLGARLAAVLAGRAAGLAVWSPEGRLVACNPRFREFYPDVPIRAGLELEDLVRFTVTRGLVQVPEAQVEAWVQARLAGARAAACDVVRTADGRWLEMRVGPSDGGETLMLYTDVTTAHEVAAALAERDAQLDGRAADLELLQAALAAAGEAGSFEAAARRINEQVCRWAGWPVGHAWRAVDGGAALAPCPQTLAIDGDGLEPMRAALAAERPARGEGLAGRVLQAGRVVWVANAQSDPTFPAARRASMPGIRGACGVPVKRGEQVVAVLEFLSREQLVPVEGTARLLESVGRALASVPEPGG